MKVPAGEGEGRSQKELPEIPGPLLKLPVLTHLDQGPQDIPRDRGRHTGQRGPHSELTLKGWQLPSSGGKGIPIRGTLGALPGVPLPCGAPSQRWGLASLSPARVMTSLTSTSSHASSQGWHPQAAARHLLLERKARSSQPL